MAGRSAVQVPVDERWLGMDRRGVPYAAVALALIVLLVGVIPAIDDAVEWDDPTVAGDVVDLGGGTRITPPVGWQLEDGILTSAESITPVNPDGAGAALTNGATSLQVTTSTWDGTADELMDQYNRLRDTSDESADRLFAVTGDRGSVTTDSGATGVQESWTAANGDGRAFALVVENADDQRIGVVVTATASDDTLGQDEASVTDFVSSLTTGATS